MAVPLSQGSFDEMVKKIQQMEKQLQDIGGGMSGGVHSTIATTLTTITSLVKEQIDGVKLTIKEMEGRVVEVEKVTGEMDAAEKTRASTAAAAAAAAAAVATARAQALEQKIEDNATSMATRVEAIERRMEDNKGNRTNKGSRLNDLKSLQQGARVFDGSLDAKSPGFPWWREDMELMIGSEYPGLEKVLVKIRFGIQDDELRMMQTDPLTEEAVKKVAEQLKK